MKRFKIVSENHVFFDVDFLSIWGGFGRVLGRVLGGVWGVLGAPWAVFWPLFWMLTLGMLSGRALAAFQGRFWLDFEGPKGSRRGPREAQEGVLGALGAHFASFFRLRFLLRFVIDQKSILEGFGVDL